MRKERGFWDRIVGADGGATIGSLGVAADAATGVSKGFSGSGILVEFDVSNVLGLSGASGGMVGDAGSAVPESAASVGLGVAVGSAMVVDGAVAGACGGSLGSTTGSCAIGAVCVPSSDMMLFYHTSLRLIENFFTQSLRVSMR